VLLCIFSITYLPLAIGWTGNTEEKENIYLYIYRKKEEAKFFADTKQTASKNKK